MAALVAFGSLAGGALAHAALPIDLEVAVVQAAPLGAMQQWGRVLSEMDLARVRLRAANRGDQPSVTTTGAGPALRLQVVGIVNHKDQLVLPGGVFRQADAAQLKQFLEDLPRQTAEQGIERGIFGLTKPQFAALYHDLSTPVDAPTKGVPLNELAANVTARLGTPVELSAGVADTLNRGQPLTADLQGYSAGTVLAIALRSAGLELAPSGPTLETVALKIVPATRDTDHWPAGWKPEQVGRVIAPAMHQFTTIEISGFTLQQALDGGLAAHMGVPLVFDARVLADRRIDPANIQVKFPRSKTYIRRAVDNILAQARLAGELRVDEAGKPFYWITQFGPDSPRALGTDPPSEGPAAPGRHQP
ncbi:MAG: hypothetical protein DCC67_19265 [Planctomycetota bacterium]|nr:MAG: hypothetical protein DCC67_19265 [Planctomycetota bacterium]